jgi:hypothetical protein
VRVAKIALLVLAFAAAVAPTPPSIVERWYSRGFYAGLQPRLTALSNLVSLPLFDVLCGVALASVIAVSWRMMRRAAAGTRWRASARVLGGIVIAAAVVYLWFLLAWGLNYRREKITTRLDFDETRVTREAVLTAASDAARRATAVRDVSIASEPRELDDLRAAFASTLSALSVPQAHPSVPKWSVFTVLWRRVGVDGMTDPFFLESLVRTDLLPFERPFVIAHEWGHLAGFADESEASFISYLTCLQGSARTQYSGWLLMYAQIASELRGADRAAAQRWLSPEAVGDLRALSEKAAREIRPTVQRANTAVYDRFLKANRLELGVRSYDEVTRLLVGTRLTDDHRPVLRP